MTGPDDAGRRYRDGPRSIGTRDRRPLPQTRKDQLLSRLRCIGGEAGTLEARIESAKRAIQDERPRFTATDAGRIQWNWYVNQFVMDLELERNRLARSAHKPTKPGETAPGPFIELLDRLGPCIHELREPDDRPEAD